MVKNNVLAERIWIILGEGRLIWDPVKKYYQLHIILNLTDERNYVFHFKNILNFLFKLEPKIYLKKHKDSREGKGIYLCIYNKSLVENLISLCLIP